MISSSSISILYIIGAYLIGSIPTDYLITRYVRRNDIWRFSSCAFLQGSGGKGVATIVGILFAIHPMILVGMLITWLAVLLYTKTIGIASVVTMVLLPCYAAMVTDVYGVALVMCMAVWIIWR